MPQLQKAGRADGSDSISRPANAEERMSEVTTICQMQKAASMLVASARDTAMAMPETTRHGTMMGGPDASMSSPQGAVMPAPKEHDVCKPVPSPQDTVMPAATGQDAVMTVPTGHAWKPAPVPCAQEAKKAATQAHPENEGVIPTSMGQEATTQVPTGHAAWKPVPVPGEPGAVMPSPAGQDAAMQVPTAGEAVPTRNDVEVETQGGEAQP